MFAQKICTLSHSGTSYCLLIFATVSEHMTRTGFELPVRMGMLESVHSWLKALFSLSTFFFLEHAMWNYFSLTRFSNYSLSSHLSPVCVHTLCMYLEPQCLSECTDFIGWIASCKINYRTCIWSVPLNQYPKELRQLKCKCSVKMLLIITSQKVCDTTGLIFNTASFISFSYVVSCSKSDLKSN